MLKRWQPIIMIAIALVLTQWAYGYWVIGPDILSQPAMRMRFRPEYTDPSLVVLLLLALLVLGRWRLPPYLADHAWFQQHPNTLGGLACAVLAVCWLFVAFSCACDYAFYYGNTWRYHEIFFGFVLLEPIALALALLFTLICWLSIRT